MTGALPEGGELLLLLSLSLLFLWIAKRRGFFRLPKEVALLKQPTFWHVLGALLTSLLSLVVALYAATYLEFLQRASGLFLCLFLLLYTVGTGVWRPLIWREQPASCALVGRAFKTGTIAWLVSLPLVQFLYGVLEKIMALLWHVEAREQGVVQQLRSLKEHSFSFGWTVLMVLMVIPFVEELLFRGFLQTYLRRYLSRGGALFVTALVFAVAHFQVGQGLSNVALLASLCLLSCFLGFIYEKERTLWAPFCMHMLFNATNLIGILFLD